MRNLLFKIYYLNRIYSAILLLIITYIPSVVLMFIHRFGGAGAIDQSYLSGETFFYALITGSVLAPLIETCLHQYLPYACFERFFRPRLICLSVLSGVVFGLAHLHNGHIMNVLWAGSIGFFLQLWFVLLARRYNYGQAFFIVAAVHALRNTISTVALFVPDLA